MGYNSVADIIGLSSFVYSRGCLQKIAESCAIPTSKVSHLGVNRKLTCDFLLVTNSNFGRIYTVFRDIDA